MANGLQVTKELLRLEEVIGEATSQIIVSRTVEIPAPKPDAMQIVDEITEVVVTKVSIVPNKVLVEGVLRVKVIYEAAVPAQTVHVFHAEVTFTHFVEIPGAEPDMTVYPTLTVESVSLEVLNPPSRRVEIRAILALFAKVVRPVELKVITNVTGIAGIQVTRETIRAEDIIGREEAQAIVRGEVTLPEAKPNVRQVIDSVASVTITQVIAILNKAIIRGTIDIRIIYEADTPYQTVHVVHGTIPFELFVEVPGLEPDMVVVATAEVEFAGFDISANRRTIIARVVVKATAKAVRVRPIEVVTDVKGLPAGYKVEKELVRIQEVLSDMRRQSIVQAVLDIPEEKPDVVSVISHKATVQVDRVLVVPNKVIVEGVIHLKTVYEGFTPEQSVHAVSHDISFSDFVHVAGAAPGMDAQVQVDVEHVSYDVGAGDPITVQIVLKITARIVRTRQIMVVVNIVAVEAICTGVVIGDMVNVRPTPSTEMHPIATLSRGTQVIIVGTEGQWFRVRLADGRMGFIFAQFVRSDCLPRG